MKFILLFLFLITPPNAIKPEDKNNPMKDKRVWTLQSTIALELASYEWCNEVAGSIARSADGTATITTRMFCIPKDQKDLQDMKNIMSDFEKKGFDEQLLLPFSQFQNQLDKPPRAKGDRQQKLDNLLQIAPGQ